MADPGPVARWLSSGAAGVVVQNLVNGGVFIVGALFAGGVIDDPIFGPVWWGVYDYAWIVFAAVLVASVMSCLSGRWRAPVWVAVGSALLTAAFLHPACPSFAVCNEVAFLFYGVAIAAIARPIGVGLITGLRYVARAADRPPSGPG